LLSMAWPNRAAASRKPRDQLLSQPVPARDSGAEAPAVTLIHRTGTGLRGKDAGKVERRKTQGRAGGGSNGQPGASVMARRLRNTGPIRIHAGAFRSAGSQQEHARHRRAASCARTPAPGSCPRGHNQPFRPLTERSIAWPLRRTQPVRHLITKHLLSTISRRSISHRSRD
jgi:hypothetical protein